MSTTTIETVEKFPLYIGGEFVDTNEHDTVRLPFDGTPVGKVPRAGEAELAKSRCGRAGRGARHGGDVQL